MKQSPQLAQVVRRMAAGVLSRDGFLGADPRPLEEVLDADGSAIAALGTTHEEIAARLREVFDQARAALGTPVRIGERLVAVHHEAMGRIPCPWGGCGVFPKGEVELTDTATGESLSLTALGIHMVGKHGFYNGRGTRYRLEPDAIARLLRQVGG
ncbi:MAG: hypothetical protein FJ290_08785 [Planctomycetes bacterium]|nr:hypothetical protein [Planctomycetota bacterium]